MTYIIDKTIKNIVEEKIESNNIIDIHNHIFPDNMASKAVESTGGYYGIQMLGKGTVSDMLESGSKIKVNKYIVHSTATKVEQVKTINDYIASVILTNNSLVGFGTLHPDLDNIDVEVQRMISLGIKGVKLHPDFQRFNIDQDNMLPLYSRIENKLPLLIHMGDRNKDFSSPKRLANILGLFPKLTVIAAHLGGYSVWNESMHYLVGKNVYLDTSSSLMFLERKKALQMIKRHGVEKVLFGTDYPMWTHKEELERVCKLELAQKELDNILWGNAKRLLNLH